MTLFSNNKAKTNQDQNATKPKPIKHFLSRTTQFPPKSKKERGNFHQKKEKKKAVILN